MAGDFPSLDVNTVTQWSKLNSTDPVKRSWFPAYSISLAVFASLVLLARIWLQARRNGPSIGLDSLLVCSAWMFSSLFTASCLVGTWKYGFDRHAWDVSGSSLHDAALIQWLSEGAFTLSVALTKISVLCFYRRLDPPCTRAFRRIIYALVALTVGYTVALILVQVLLCRPITAYWAVPDAHTQGERACASQHIYYPIHGLIGVLSTLYSIAIPFFFFRNIPMALSQRRAMRFIFLFALSIVAAGIARTVFLIRLTSSSNGDATWNGFNVFVFAQLECQLALISASLPYLHCYMVQDPSMSLIYYVDNGKHDSVISRVSSSLSGHFKRIPLGRSSTPRILEVPRPSPLAAEIPEWEFATLESVRYVGPPVDESTYEQYVRGNFGPPAPPKDSRALFDQYRREHGEVIQGLE